MFFFLTYVVLQTQFYINILLKYIYFPITTANPIVLKYLVANQYQSVGFVALEKPE